MTILTTLGHIINGRNAGQDLALLSTDADQEQGIQLMAAFVDKKFCVSLDHESTEAIIPIPFVNENKKVYFGTNGHKIYVLNNQGYIEEAIFLESREDVVGLDYDINVPLSSIVKEFEWTSLTTDEREIVREKIKTITDNRQKLSNEKGINVDYFKEGWKTSYNHILYPTHHHQSKTLTSALL